MEEVDLRPWGVLKAALVELVKLAELKTRHAYPSAKDTEVIEGMCLSRLLRAPVTRVQFLSFPLTQKKPACARMAMEYLDAEPAFEPCDVTLPLLEDVASHPLIREPDLTSRLKRVEQQSEQELCRLVDRQEELHARIVAAKQAKRALQRELEVTRSDVETKRARLEAEGGGKEEEEAQFVTPLLTDAIDASDSNWLRRENEEVKEVREAAADAWLMGRLFEASENKWNTRKKSNLETIRQEIISEIVRRK
jgi:hypothetical protein